MTTTMKRNAAGGFDVIVTDQAGIELKRCSASVEHDQALDELLDVLNVRQLSGLEDTGFFQRPAHTLDVLEIHDSSGGESPMTFFVLPRVDSGEPVILYDLRNAWEVDVPKAAIRALTSGCPGSSTDGR